MKVTLSYVSSKLFSDNRINFARVILIKPNMFNQDDRDMKLKKKIIYLEAAQLRLGNGICFSNNRNNVYFIV